MADHDLPDTKEVSDEDLLESNRLARPGNSSSSLENLPAELRTKILSWMPDLPTLRSLVRASPTLHAQYMYSRNGTLRTCLERELDGFLVDACANLMSRAHVLGSPRTDEMITGFLASYRGWLSGPAPYSKVKSSHIRWMSAYHLSVAHPLARLYSRWALGNLETTVSKTAEIIGDYKTQQCCIESESSLSQSEKIRVFRGLYRYETYYHLFGRNKGKRDGWFSHHEINGLFFSLFDPWEVESVGCIERFVRQKYKDIFEEIKSDLLSRSPESRLQNGVSNLHMSFNLDTEHDSYMNGTMSRGLTMTVRLLTINDHHSLVTEMERCLAYRQGLDSPMRRALGTVAQHGRRQDIVLPNSRDLLEDRADEMIFLGDDLPPLGPPLGWVLLWSQKYANIYGGYVPESLRRAGYVMWDKQRWIDMEATELVDLEWLKAPELVDEIQNDYGWNPIQRGSASQWQANRLPDIV